MGDPLYSEGIGIAVVLITLVKVLITFAILLIATMFMVWFERKIISDMQYRIGPNRAGPWGLLQTLADGIKAFFKEDLLPTRADKIVFRLAPVISATTAFLSFAIIPLGGDFFGGGTGSVTVFGHETYLQLADPPIGVLFFLAMSALGVYGIMLAGWASGSKYPLLGSVRASAQIVSYEAALGLSLAAVLLVTRAVSTHGIVAAQTGDGFGTLRNWNVLTVGIVPFVIFLIAGTAELNRPPFDLVEAEQELVGGFHTEYSSIRFALFYLAEFMNTVTMSALIVTLFFGGPAGLFDIPGIPNWLEGVVWFLAKVFVFLYLFVWFRGTLPRLRYDQLMNLGWKRLIPAALLWLMVLGAIRVGQSSGLSSGGWALLIAIMVVSVVVAVGLLSLSLNAAERNHRADEAYH
ncbi:MAG: NADH-quinone oxidoreductase subunit NuoH [Acidimicrobiia bacterium]|nr:NADH-quinone oxidoreductase subunit NuoH [Acidimicrobiia bacterium]